MEGAKETSVGGVKEKTLGLFTCITRRVAKFEYMGINRIKLEICKTASKPIKENLNVVEEKTFCSIILVKTNRFNANSGKFVPCAFHNHMQTAQYFNVS